MTALTRLSDPERDRARRRDGGPREAQVACALVSEAGGMDSRINFRFNQANNDVSRILMFRGFVPSVTLCGNPPSSFLLLTVVHTVPPLTRGAFIGANIPRQTPIYRYVYTFGTGTCLFEAGSFPTAHQFYFPYP